MFNIDGAVKYTKLLFERVPEGSNFFIVLNDERIRIKEGSDSDSIQWKKERSRYNVLITSLAKSYPYVIVVPFSEFIRDENEIQLASGGNHYAAWLTNPLIFGGLEKALKFGFPGRLDGESAGWGSDASAEGAI